MLAYAIKRVIQIIPTIFVIAIAAFMLQSLAPGDTVADRLTVEGVTIHNSRDDYLSAYRDLQKKMHRDIPLFYFSIAPSYFPDTLHRIIPKQKKTLLTNLLRQTKDWNTVEEFYVIHLKARRELEAQSKDYKIALSVVNKMANAMDLGGISSHQLALLDNLKDLDNSTLPYTSSLVETINKFNSSSRFSWPTLRWHGFSNQFQYWIFRIFSRDNKSVVDGEPVRSKISRALSWTASLGLITIIIVGVFSLLLAYVQVYYKDKWFDKVVSVITYFLIAVPAFWLATLMVVFFTTPEYGAWTDIFPSVGIKPSFVERSFLQELWANAAQLILPIFTLSILSIAYLGLQIKSDLLRVLNLPFVTAARSRGLTKSQNLKSHVLPNGLMTYIILMTGAIPFVFTGSVIIEVIFNIPGVGRLMLYSIQQEDWPVVFTIVLVISVVTILGYIAGDLLLMKLYPKTRESFTHE